MFDDGYAYYSLEDSRPISISDAMERAWIAMRRGDTLHIKYESGRADYMTYEQVTEELRQEAQFILDHLSE